MNTSINYIEMMHFDSIEYHTGVHMILFSVLFSPKYVSNTSQLSDLLEVQGGFHALNYLNPKNSCQIIPNNRNGTSSRAAAQGASRKVF